MPNVKIKLTDEQTDEIMEEMKAKAIHHELNMMYRSFVVKTAALICHEEGEDEFTDSEDDELLTIVEKDYPDMYAILEEVYMPDAVENFYGYLMNKVKEIVRNRTKVYEFRVHYSGEITLYVRAHDSEEAEDFIRNHCDVHDAIAEDFDDSDIDEIDCYAAHDEDDVPYLSEVLDACE